MGLKRWLKHLFAKKPQATADVIVNLDNTLINLVRNRALPSAAELRQLYTPQQLDAPQGDSQEIPVYLAGTSGYYQGLLTLLEAGANPYTSYQDDNLMHVFIRQRRNAWMKLLVFYDFDFELLTGLEGVDSQALIRQYQIRELDYESDYSHLKNIETLSKNIKRLSKSKRIDHYIFIGEIFTTRIAILYERCEREVERNSVEAAYPEAQQILMQHYRRKAIEAYEQGEYYYQQAVESGYKPDYINFIVHVYEASYRLLIKDNQLLKACEYALKSAHFRQTIYLQEDSLSSARLFIDRTIVWFNNYYNLALDLINQGVLPTHHKFILAAQQARFYLDLIKSPWSIMERDEYLNTIRRCCEQLAQADNPETYQALQTEFAQAQAQALTIYENQATLAPLGTGCSFFAHPAPVAEVSAEASSQGANIILPRL